MTAPAWIAPAWSAAAWPWAPGGGAISEEHAMAFDRDRPRRLLIVPALFDEANKLKRLTVEVMRRLDAAGIDCFLPDLPGTGESLLLLETLSLDDWRDAMTVAARHFAATHVLGIRGGALLTPQGLAGWRYAPVKGASILRQMIRARVLAAREAGVKETAEALLRMAETEGVELAGYSLSAELARELEKAVPASDAMATIAQDSIGGSGLWLRSEPDEDRVQADALAATLAVGMLS